MFRTRLSPPQPVVALSERGGPKLTLIGRCPITSAWLTGHSSIASRTVFQRGSIRALSECPLRSCETSASLRRYWLVRPIAGRAAGSSPPLPDAGSTADAAIFRYATVARWNSIRSSAPRKRMAERGRVFTTCACKAGAGCRGIARPQAIAVNYAHSEAGPPPGRGCHGDEHQLERREGHRRIQFPKWEWADAGGETVV